jgi:hypothetical protein
MRNVADRSWGENQNTHFVFCNFFPKYFVIYEIMRKNMVEPDRPEMTVYVPFMLDN